MKWREMNERPFLSCPLPLPVPFLSRLLPVLSCPSLRGEWRPREETASSTLVSGWGGRGRERQVPSHHPHASMLCCYAMSPIKLAQHAMTYIYMP